MVNYKYLETYMTEFKEDSNDCEETVGNNIISAFTMPETPVTIFCLLYESLSCINTSHIEI